MDISVATREERRVRTGCVPAPSPLTLHRTTGQQHGLLPRKHKRCFKKRKPGILLVPLGSGPGCRVIAGSGSVTALGIHCL